jgi:O-antigen ligase
LPVAAVVAVAPSGLAPFGPIKWALVPTLVLLGILALSRDGRLSFRGGRALAGFVGWTALTALFGLDRVYAWTGTPERHFGVIAWVLVALCWWAGRSLDGPARRLVLSSGAATAGVLGLWAGAESLGWQPLRLAGIGDRPVGPLGSSAFLGAAAVLLTPVAVGWAMQTAGRARVLASVAAALGLVALAASGARAAIFGAVVAAVVAVVVQRDRRVLIVVGACALIGGAVAVASGAGGRVSSVATDRDGGARGRLDEWRVAVRVVGSHPILGTGPEGYRIAFGKGVDDRYERDHGRNPVPDRAHNALLDVAATTGLPGLALYLAAVAIALGAALRALRNGPPLLAGAGLGVIAYFVQSLFLFPLAELEPVVWLLAGLCAAERVAPPRRERRIVSAAAGVLAVAAAVAGVLDVASDRRAKQDLALIAQDRIAPANASAWRPDQVRYRLVDARVHQSDGSTRGLGRALRDVDAALRVSPRDPVAQREKGRILLEQARRGGRVGVARGYLARLLRDDPRNAETLLRLGIAHDLAGDDAGAIAAWRRAEYLAPDSASASSNLAVAYAKAGRTAAARAAATRALRRDPHNQPARAVLAELEKSGT